MSPFSASAPEDAAIREIVDRVHREVEVLSGFAAREPLILTD
jgi:hypothetical protein